MSRSWCQALFAGLIALAFGAAAAYAQATFYEAYSLGLEHAKAGRFDDARDALLRAVELRAEPGTNLRTYGLNFLDRYQPYLALARVELELGRLDDAEDHLRQAAEPGGPLPVGGDAPSGPRSTAQQPVARGFASTIRPVHHPG